MNWLRKIYHHKAFPRLFYIKPDGGKDSGVTGYFLIEWKILFSIGLLRFSEGSREAFHNHAFNAFTFWLKGKVIEEDLKGTRRNFVGPSRHAKYTPRDKCHKVHGVTTTWALTFRGPWVNYWKEFRESGETTLTHGRKIVQESEKDDD